MLKKLPNRQNHMLNLPKAAFNKSIQTRLNPLSTRNTGTMQETIGTMPILTLEMCGRNSRLVRKINTFVNDTLMQTLLTTDSPDLQNTTKRTNDAWATTHLHTIRTTII